jgi:hypothetical protein
MKLDDLDPTAQRLVRIAEQAGCLFVNPITGDIAGLYDIDAESRTYRRISAAAENGELGFVDIYEVMEEIEAIITHCHPEMEDRD